MLQYEDFLISFQPLYDDHDPLHIQSPAGSLDSTFQIPEIEGRSLLALADHLGPGLRTLDNKSRNLFFESETEAVDPATFGERLYAVLFMEEVRALWDRSV
ncbi:MAG: hypothetical protein AAGM67_09240 [Bacteroidota bacterium]